MASLRGWSARKAHEEWERTRVDALVKRDNLGIRGAERLHVPSMYFAGLGLDRATKRKSTYQDKQLVTSSKARRVTPQERARTRGELNKGFRRADAETAAATFGSMHEALPSGQ